jgi:hypothetical protein
MGTEATPATIRDLCDELGRSTDTVSRAWRKLGLTEWSVTRIPTTEEILAIRSFYSGIPSALRPAPSGNGSVSHGTTDSVTERPRNDSFPFPAVPSGNDSVAPPPPVPAARNTTRSDAEGRTDSALTDRLPWERPLWASCLLIFVIACPTGASVHNMYVVTSQFSDNVPTAVMYTVVLSVTALAFVIAGVRSRNTYFLAALLLLFEAMCNTLQVYKFVYAGGNLSDIMRLATEFLGTTPHGTARALSLFAALTLSAVQYIALYELSLKPIKNSVSRKKKT